MQHQEHQISIAKTARYYTIGDITTAKRVWFVFHGYGQLAKYFIKNFEALDLNENYIIAPEGLNRFYINGLSGRVGATWMTKEARLDDIADYIAYIEQVYQEAIAARANREWKVLAFGFSQGVATVTRWLTQTPNRPKATVLWAGSFPPDLEPVRAKQAFDGMRTIGCVGDSDQFIDAQQLALVKTHLSELKIQVEWLNYKGGHAILTGALLQLQKMLDSDI